MQSSLDASEVRKAEEILTEVHFRNAMRSQAPSEKLMYLEKALSLAPHEGRIHFQRGIALLQTGKAAEAIKAFDLTAKTEPEREGLAFLRQLAWLADKQSLKSRVKLSEAETNTLTLIELFQKSSLKTVLNNKPAGDVMGAVPIWNVLLTMRHDKKFTEAELAQKDGIPASNKRISAILEYYQGVAAMREGNPNIAHKFWQNVLSGGFSTPWIQKNVGISMRDDFLNLFNAQRWAEIGNKSQRLPAELNDETLNQMLSLALFHLGYEQAQKEKWTQAVKYWSRAAKRSYNRYLAQNLALAQEKMGQWENAAEAWRDVLQRRPRSPKHANYLSEKQVAAIWAHVSHCYWEVYDEKESVNCLRKAIQYDPENLDLRFKLVSNLMSKDYEDQEGAIKALNEILDVAPDNIRALTELAHLYHIHWKYDEIPVWKRILEVEPDNLDARHELAHRYIEKAIPAEKPGKHYYYKNPPLKEQLKILHEGLEVLPDHPDLVLALGWAYVDGKKHKEARKYLLRAFELAPQDPHIAGSILQNLIIIKADELIEPMLPEMRKIKGLLPGYWIDQGKDALAKSLSWGERFFDAALEQLEYTPQGTQASVLVDIWMSIPHEDRKYQGLKKKYLTKIEQDVPQSGAVEYIQSFVTFSKTQNTSKARRLLRTAKKLAQAAHDTILLQHIESAEKMLSMPPPPADLLNMLEGMDEGMFQELLEKMGEGFP